MDNQRDMDELKAHLAFKTKECDRIECRLIHQISELKALNEDLRCKLEEKTIELKDKTAELNRKTVEWRLERETLLEQVNICKAIAEMKQIKDYLEWDRDLKKRHRAE